MTTIAFDGKVLAADGQLTRGSNICNLNTQKLFICPSDEEWWITGERIVAFGVSGDITGQLALLETVRLRPGYKGLTQSSQLPAKMDFTFLRLLASGKAIVGGKREDDVTLWWSEATPPLATGSGYEYALGAMKMGASAVRAIEIASECDIYTGGEISTYELRR